MDLDRSLSSSILGNAHYAVDSNENKQNITALILLGRERHANTAKTNERFNFVSKKSKSISKKMEEKNILPNSI